MDSILPASIGIRFHKESLEGLALKSRLFESIYALAPKSFQGVYRVATIKLAEKMGCKPYNIPRILYQVQEKGEAGIAYETDNESFILQVTSLPKQAMAMQLCE